MKKTDKSKLEETKIDIRSLTLSEMERFIISLGEKKFRALQVFEWINRKLANSFDEMTNLSKELRSKLSEQSYISEIKILEKLESAELLNDKTKKYLFQLENKTIIESVFMEYSHGNSVCISSQAGCKMGCVFCASTVNGIERDLTAGEILAQVYEIQKDTGEKISNIVVMGSGEPFDNFENVMKFLEIINDEKGLNIGRRRVTISTCGLVDRIYEFAEQNLQTTLAISLHAPNDKIRKQIMPIAKRESMEELLLACKYYSNKTNRRVTYEYALIDGLNDSIEDAKELGAKLRRTLCHVNLISVNEIAERNYKGSSNEKALKFSKTLEQFGVVTTIRRKLGSDINAACGQLRNSYKDGGHE